MRPGLGGRLGRLCLGGKICGFACIYLEIARCLDG